MVVPSNSAEIESWREYFFAVRVRLFGSGILMVVSIIFGGTLAGVSPLDSLNAPLYALLAVFAVGAVSEKPVLHNVLALVPPAMITGMLLGPIAQANWAAP